MGFEHSIATNMYFIPPGLLLKGNTAITGLLSTPEVSNLTLFSAFEQGKNRGLK
jgi:hypothetical protein